MRVQGSFLIVFVLASGSAIGCGEEPTPVPADTREDRQVTRDLVSADGDAQEAVEIIESDLSEEVVSDIAALDVGRSDVADLSIDMSVAAVTCGQGFTGPALDEFVPEAEPGYADDVAALGTLPASVDYSGLFSIQMSTVNYMLGRTEGTFASEEDLDAAGPMGEAIRAAAAAGGGQIDYLMLRRGLHHNYYCSRAIPPALSAFRATYGDYETWTSTDVSCSRAKDGPRRLYVHPSGDA
ncbi:MAG: hypothetical protein KC561_03650, partial [Myxococcales bacterium]|nr:hypothetical protein [Myxococcales bacterium]